jgi:transcriptional regulator GlxA family with amidase domain
LEYLKFLLSSRAIVGAVAEDRGVRDSVEALMETLFRRTCLPAIGDGRRRPIVSRDVRNAEAYIRESLPRDVRLMDIAAAAGVSMRTLQANFQRHHGVSPMTYMRDLRLDVARDRILAGATSADAAFDCGFMHPGRFAQYYRSRFGHSPSSAQRASVPAID